ncbi:DUF6434 domain-containing protein [Pseudoneobacillus sp. C159]
MRPTLTKDISIEDFKNYYWLKEELQIYCREIGISATGSKMDITKRIEIFLRTGEVISLIRKSRGNSKSKLTVLKEINLDTVITENHRCSQEVRAFFKSAISPKFHFSTFIQNYIKNNIGKTYRDVVAAWHEEEKRKKDPAYQTNISSQFEYNQFTRDFFADPKNQGKSREDVIEAWNKIKKLPGNNKYIPSM